MHNVKVPMIMMAECMNCCAGVTRATKFLECDLLNQDNPTLTPDPRHIPAPQALNYIYKVSGKCIELNCDEEHELCYLLCQPCWKIVSQLYQFHKKLTSLTKLNSLVNKTFKVLDNQIQELSEAETRYIDHDHDYIAVAPVVSEGLGLRLKPVDKSDPSQADVMSSVTSAPKTLNVETASPTIPCPVPLPSNDIDSSLAKEPIERIIQGKVLKIGKHVTSSVTPTLDNLNTVTDTSAIPFLVPLPLNDIDSSLPKEPIERIIQGKFLKIKDAMNSATPVPDSLSLNAVTTTPTSSNSMILPSGVLPSNTAAIKVIMPSSPNQIGRIEIYTRPSTEKISKNTDIGSKLVKPKTVKRVRGFTGNLLGDVLQRPNSGFDEDPYPKTPKISKKFELGSKSVKTKTKAVKTITVKPVPQSGTLLRKPNSDDDPYPRNPKISKTSDLGSKSVKPKSKAVKTITVKPVRQLRALLPKPNSDNDPYPSSPKISKKTDLGSKLVKPKTKAVKNTLKPVPQSGSGTLLQKPNSKDNGPYPSTPKISRKTYPGSKSVKHKTVKPVHNSETRSQNRNSFDNNPYPYFDFDWPESPKEVLAVDPLGNNRRVTSAQSLSLPTKQVKVKPKARNRVLARTHSKPACDIIFTIGTLNPCPILPAALDSEATATSGSELQPIAASESQPIAKSESQPIAESESQPIAKSESHPIAASESQPISESEPHPIIASESRPIAKLESQPKVTSESQPLAESESEPHPIGAPESGIQPIATDLELTADIQPSVPLTVSDLIKLQKGLRKPTSYVRVLPRHLRKAKASSTVPSVNANKSQSLTTTMVTSINAGKLLPVQFNRKQQSDTRTAMFPNETNSSLNTVSTAGINDSTTTGIQFAAAVSSNRRKQQHPYYSYDFDRPESPSAVIAVDPLQETQKVTSDQSYVGIQSTALSGKRRKQHHAVRTPTDFPDDQVAITDEKPNCNSNIWPSLIEKQIISRQRQKLRIKRNHGTKSKSCLECGKVFKSRNGFKHHIKYYHQNQNQRRKTKVTCPICEKPLRGNFALPAHLNSHRNPVELAESSKLVCPECEKVFKSNMGFQNHIKHYHEKQKRREREKVTCPICGKPLGGKYALPGHLNSHRHRDPVELERAAEIQRRLAVARDSLKFVCPKCGKTFSCQSQMQCHMKRHLPVSSRQVYSCTVPKCTSSYLDKGSLRLHMMKIHKASIYLKCPRCSRRFRKRSELKNHRPLCANSIKKAKCLNCGKRLKQKKSLIYHYTNVHKMDEEKAKALVYPSKRIISENRESTRPRRKVGIGTRNVDDSELYLVDDQENKIYFKL